MIKIIHENGKAYPSVICDVCDKKIDNAKNANVVWKEEEEPSLENVFYVHKGICDKSISSKISGVTAWDNLDSHLVRILLTTNLLSFNETDKGFSPNYSEITKVIENMKLLNEYFGY